MLSRRQLLGRALALAGAPWLAACRRQDSRDLLACRGDLPSAWLDSLPPPWRLRLLESPQAVLAATSPSSSNATPGRNPGLAQLSDGWAGLLPARALAPLGRAVEALISELDPIALPPSRLYAPAGAPPLAFPWAMGTWLLVLRNRPDLAARAEAGWELLLHPDLRGRLVLPSSPRLVIELARRLPSDAGSAGNDLAAALRQLRAQALAYDERDGLNLLLSGEAAAAVLPSQRVLPLLRRDPRLTALLPASGSPLGWSLLLRPAGAPPPPLDWLKRLQHPALLQRLLAAGWVPPLPRAQLAPLLRHWPADQARLLLPPAEVLARCTSLAPLAPAAREELQKLWDGSAGQD